MHQRYKLDKVIEISKELAKMFPFTTEQIVPVVQTLIIARDLSIPLNKAVTSGMMSKDLTNIINKNFAGLEFTDDRCLAISKIIETVNDYYVLKYGAPILESKNEQ